MDDIAVFCGALGRNESLEITLTDALTNFLDDDTVEMKTRQDGRALPSQCCRFMLPLAMIKALAEHPLSSDLYLSSAGFYPRDPRTYTCDRQQYNLLYYCVGGSMTLHIGNSSWPVVSGDLIVLPQGLIHVTESDADAPWTFYWIAYAGTRRDEYTQFLNVTDPVTALGLQPELIAELDALCALRNSDFAVATFVIGANRLKSLITRFGLVRSNSPEVKKGRIDLDRLRRLMATRMDGSLQLEGLARASNLSPYYFSRNFKQLTGLSPMYYYTQLRIQHACYLLTETRESIALVASKVGYPDPRYFSRTFRRVVGMTPQTYRDWGIKGHEERSEME